LDKKVNPRWDCHLHVFDPDLPTLGGHYAPQAASLAQVQKLGAPFGIERFVLVQPSVYGLDNSVMLRALQAAPGLHRGIAVLDETVSESQLQQMHELGVRASRPSGDLASTEPCFAPFGLACAVVCRDR
jgi:predicted TIM-barrel fold metal-dependent hydrolase